MMLNTARELVTRGYEVDLLCDARRAKLSAPDGVDLKPLASYPGFIGRIMAWRADPEALSVMARPVLFCLIAPEPLLVVHSASHCRPRDVQADLRSARAG